MSKYTRKMVGGVAFAFSANIIAAGFAYLIRIVLARNLTQEGFGLIYATFALFGLVSIFAHLGLNEALVKYIAEFIVRKKEKEIKFMILFSLILQLIFAAIVTVIFYFTADLLAASYFKNPAASIMIKIFALAFLLAPFELLIMASLTGFQKIKIFSLATASRQIFLFLLTFLLITLGFDLLSYPISILAVYVLTFVVYAPYFFIKTFPNFFKHKFTYDKKLVKKLVTFGIPVMLTASATVVLSYTDTLLITYFRSLTEVAFYQVALPTAQVLWLFSSSVAAVLLPLSSELWTKKKEYLKQGTTIIHKYALIIILPLAFGLFSFSDVIITLLFGAEYISAALTLKILAIGAIFVTLNQINMTLISGTGHPKFNSKIVWTGAGLNFIINLFLIPRLGIEGAAISTTVSFGIILLYSHIKLKSITELKLDYVITIRTIGCALGFIALVYLLKSFININVWIKLPLVLGVALTAYIGALFLIKIVTKKEMDLIKKRILG